MSFGQELKDFAAAFGAGYNIGADRRDKKWMRDRAALNDPIDREYKQAQTEATKLRNKWYDKIADVQTRTGEKNLEWYDRKSQAAIDASDASIFGNFFGGRRGAKPAERLTGDAPEGEPEASGAPVGGAVGDHYTPDDAQDAAQGYNEDAGSDTDEDGDATVEPTAYAPAGSSGEVYNRFMQTVYKSGVRNPNGLAAIAATANRESRFNPKRAYGTWADPSESGQHGVSGGIMSWRDNRYVGLQKFAARMGDDPNRPSPETQAKYLFFEDPSLKDKLNAASSPREAQQIMNNAWAFAGYDRDSPERRARLSLADQYAQNYGQFLSRGGIVVHAAVGGTIPALPVDDEEDQDAAVPAPQVAQALPMQAPVPTQRPVDQPAPTGDDTSGGNATPADVGYDPSLAGDPRVVGFTKAHEAVLDGMRYSLQQMGLAKGVAVQDPDRAAKMAEYLKGAGAAPKKIIDQAYDAVDPKKELPESERTMAALGMVYDHYVRQGDPTKAKAAAASIVQYQRKLFQQYTAIAKAAVADGDIDAATKAAIKAYDSVPDGQSLKVKKLDSGRYQIDITDEATGKTISKPVLTPQEIGGWAMQVNPGSFDQFIMEAAGQRKQGGGPPSEGFQTLAAGIDEGKMPSNKDMAALPLSEQKELRQRVTQWQKENAQGGAKPPTYSESNKVRGDMATVYDDMAGQTMPGSDEPVHQGMADLDSGSKKAIIDAASDIVGSPRNRSPDYNVSETDAISAAFVVSQADSSEYKATSKDNGTVVELSDGTQVWMPKQRFVRLQSIYKRNVATLKKQQQDQTNAKEDSVARSKRNAVRDRDVTDNPNLFGDPNTPSPLIGQSQSTIDDLQKLMGQ